LVAEYETGGVFSGLTFAADDKLYLGSNNGSLQLLSRGIDNNWNLQQVWQGPAGIRVLRASPRGDFLILIDDNNLASQLILAESRLGDATLQLPSEVQEVVFNANGTRAYFRSSRWVHRASLSTSGLIWTDALFVPRALNGAGIVYGDGASDSQIGQRLFLPTSKNGYIAIVELNFDGSSSTKLFGSRDELLEEWRGRTIATPLAESGPVPQALQP
jgi:hypothetical protein